MKKYLLVILLAGVANADPSFNETTLTAANTSPILAGTSYTYVNATGVVFNSVFSTGTTTSVAAGDVFVDLSTGGTALVSTSGATTVTLQAAITTAVNGGSFEIHKKPSNLTGSRALGATVAPKTLEWYVDFLGTGTNPSLTLQWYVWNPSAGRWRTVSASGVYGANDPQSFALSSEAWSMPQMKANGTAYTYTTAAGTVTSVTFTAGGYYHVRAGQRMMDKSTKYVTDITATLPTSSKWWTATGLATGLDDGAFFIRPQVEDVWVYPYVSAYTGTPIQASIFSRTVNE